jgi:peptidoglycan DL-endopeptidase LytE
MKILYLLCIHIVIAIFLSGNAVADTTYVVRKGDNPSTISKKFNVSTKVIMEANNIDPRRLKPGTKITIPSEREASAGKKGLTGKDMEKEGIQKADRLKQKENPSFHIVKKGDTLSSLARKYSLSVGELKKINNLTSDMVKTGQKLLVKEGAPKTYTVKKGDTIYGIARRFHKDEWELIEINNIDAGLLHPGRMILLEPEEDTMEARTYGAIISQAYNEEESEETAESVELSNASLQDRLILFAKKMLDIPYRFGGNSIWGIDCSAYVQKVYRLIGINLPRSAREQFTEGDPVDKEELSTGDLVFFRTYASFPSHVGIYLGNDLFIHASSKSKKVTIDSLDTPYYLKRFIGAKRVIDGQTFREVTGREG